MSVKKISMSVFVFICLLLVMFLLKAYMGGQFHSVESLQEYVAKFGVFAPVILVLIQAMQVVIPVLPGFLGCSVGAVLFGETNFSPEEYPNDWSSPDAPAAPATTSAAEAADLEAMTIPQLKEYAKEHGINLAGKTLKADIVAAIKAEL